MCMFWLQGDIRGDHHLPIYVSLYMPLTCTFPMPAPCTIAITLEGTFPNNTSNRVSNHDSNRCRETKSETTLSWIVYWMKGICHLISLIIFLLQNWFAEKKKKEFGLINVSISSGGNSQCPPVPVSTSSVCYFYPGRVCVRSIRS